MYLVIRTYNVVNNRREYIAYVRSYPRNIDVMIEVFSNFEPDTCWLQSMVTYSDDRWRTPWMPKFSRNKRKRQPIGMPGRSSGNHNWLLANASVCVSCGFRLRNASDCVWMETGLDVLSDRALIVLVWTWSKVNASTTSREIADHWRDQVYGWESWFLDCQC